MRAWIARIRSTITERRRAWRYQLRDTEPLPKEVVIDQADARGVLSTSSDVERGLLQLYAK